jgi:aspartyl-tRNA(Asn)/glutamyl-tRNA(Gln) amidotransferase subunit C
MSGVNEENVRRVARLARIAYSEADDRLAVRDFNRILDFVDVLQKVDVSGVLPTAQVTGLQDVLREDIVRPSSVKPDELLKRAPRTENRYIVVKRVLT